MFNAIFATAAKKKVSDKLSTVDQHLSKSKENIQKLRAMRGTFEIVYQKLYDNSEALEFILENLDTFVGYIDNNLIYVYANRAYEKIFDLDREEIIGKSVKEVLESKDLWEHRKEDIEKVLSGERIDFSIRKEITGNDVNLNCCYIPHICEKDGIVKGFIVIAKPFS